MLVAGLCEGKSLSAPPFRHVDTRVLPLALNGGHSILLSSLMKVNLTGPVNHLQEMTHSSFPGVACSSCCQSFSHEALRNLLAFVCPISSCYACLFDPLSFPTLPLPPPQAFPPLGHAASCQSQLVNLPSSLDPPAQLSSSFIPSLGGLWLPNPPLWFFSQMLIKIKSWASFWVHFKIILSMRWRTPKGILMSPVAAFSSVVRFRSTDNNA